MSDVSAPGIALAKATSLHGLPVVELSSGDAVADIKDVLYAPARGRVTGFTLNQRGGLFAGPMREALPMSAVHAIGRDAVMIDSLAAATDPAGGSSSASVDELDLTRNVIDDQVLTEGGDRLGTVTDLIVEIGVLDADGPASVVGYEIQADPSLQDHLARADAPLLIPLPSTLAVSGSNLVVPANVRPFIRDDLSGFGAAVAEYRSQLDEEVRP